MARVALLQDIFVEYMGFMCISAVLKAAGHSVELFIDDQSNEDAFHAEVKAFRPDIVGFSILSPSVPWALRTARRLKAEIGVLTIFGNVHAITSPQIIDDPGVDIVCLGEGEYMMRELADCLDRGASYLHIQGLWIKAGDRVIKNGNHRPIEDLNALPFHDRAMYDKYTFFRHSKYIRFLAGRGCPFRCSFCTNPVLADHYGTKDYLRKLSPERAVAELERLVRDRNPRHVFFIDEVLWFKNSWLVEFLTLYKERVGRPFTANFRFGGIEEQHIKIMKEAGAKSLIFATETADETQRFKVMNKPVKNHDILRIGEWFHRYGIEFSSSVFFGLPGDTVDDHIKRLEFFRKLRPTYLWTTFFQPYPGLKLTENFEVQAALPTDQEFKQTLHHDMYLDLPDRARLVNLKKVYFLLMIWPKSSRVLGWLINYRIPLLFDALFLLHFSYYAFKFERISFIQFLHHLRVFALNPLLRKKQTLQTSGRSFTISPSAKTQGAGSAGR